MITSNSPQIGVAPVAPVRAVLDAGPTQMILECHDLARDPFELHNLAAKPA